MTARGFLEIARQEQPERHPLERVADHEDIHRRLGAEDLGRQGARCMSCGIPFCLDGCPLGNLIPDWNDLVSAQRWREAIDQLHATNPFPELTGLICPAPCESACVLERNDEPVTIKQIELSIIERAWSEGWVVARPPRRRTGRHVAVVGSGPAGMAAAAALNDRGHTVEVHERDEAPGGLNRFGVPDAKLAKAVIDRRIDLMQREGITFTCGSDVGGAVDAEALRAGADALVIATGARVPRPLEVPGAALAGVHEAMEYLYARNRAVAAATAAGGEAAHRAGEPGGASAPSAAGRDVVVIGGGDTSADCMSNALREGARTVVALDTYPAPQGRRSREIAGWPNAPRRLPTHYALDEGGRRRSAVSVTRLCGEAGRVRAVEVVRVDGDRQPIAGTEFLLPADLVLVAIGFTAPEPGLPDALGVARVPRGTIDAERHATGVPGVFAAGDARVGASLTVTAINDGRRCAAAVDHWLTTRA